MLIRGVTRGEIVRIASELDLWPQWTSSRYAAFGLKPKGERFREVLEDEDDPSELTYVTCAHGVQAFLTVLFEEYPNAWVRTMIATYDGLDVYTRIQPQVVLRYYKKFGEDTCSCAGITA